jgi:shikimate dehydrogenase
MKVSGSTKIVGIIGYPVSHSISPQMHNAAFEHLGLNLEYVPFEVNPGDIKKALDGMRAEGVLGFNVTIPHKETIIPLLDEVTKLPRIIGAVNTVKNEGGKLVGYNTDGAGFIESLKEDAGFNTKGKKAVLLGAGGAAKAIVVMLAESGASSISITDIEPKRAENLAKYVGSLFETKIKSIPSGSEELNEAILKADLLVNATPIGMHPKENVSPIGKNTKIKNGSVVFDLIYNPPETRLMKDAKKSGAKVFNGLGMLVRQGALALSIWTEQKAPVEVMWKAAKKALGIS